jgi:hypothetical protein
MLTQAALEDADQEQPEVVETETEPVAAQRQSFVCTDDNYTCAWRRGGYD